jgi:hypothetical protein
MAATSPTLPEGGGEFVGLNALEQLEQPVVGEFIVNLQ